MTVSLTFEQWQLVRDFAQGGIDDLEQHANNYPWDFEGNTTDATDLCDSGRQVLADINAQAIYQQSRDKAPASEQHRIACQAKGWQYVTGCPQLLRICGEDYGIAHLPTIFGDASHNDSIYSTWTECFSEALGGQP